VPIEDTAESILLYQITVQRGTAAASLAKDFRALFPARWAILDSHFGAR
jgi:hypothetical protein